LPPRAFAAQAGKTAGLESFFGVDFFFQRLSRLLRSFAGLPYRFNTLYAKSFRGFNCFFKALKRASPFPMPQATLTGLLFFRLFAEAFLLTKILSLLRSYLRKRMA